VGHETMIQYLIGAGIALIGWALIQKYWAPCIDPPPGCCFGLGLILIGGVVFFSEQIIWLLSIVLTWGISNVPS